MSEQSDEVLVASGATGEQGVQASSDRVRDQLETLYEWRGSEKTEEYDDENIKYPMAEIHRLVDDLGLPEFLEDRAQEIYLEAYDDSLIRGHAIEAMAAACVHIATREAEMPRSLDEVADASRVNRSDVITAYRHIVNNLESIRIDPISPSQYVERYVEQVNKVKRRRGEEPLSEETMEKAKEMIDGTEAVSSGKSPSGFAAAAIYAASLIEDENVNQRDLAEVFGGSEKTIRDRYKDILYAWGEEHEYEVPERFREGRE